MTLSVWHIYLFQIMSKPFGDGIDFRFQTFLMHKFKYAFMCNPWLYKFLNDSFHFQILDLDFRAILAILMLHIFC